MQKNEVYELDITGMTEEGDGVGRIDGLAVFVPFTLVGERVRVQLVKVLKSFAYGKLLDVLQPSSHRVLPACPHFYKCGGCALWHMDYAAELSYKQQKVQDCLRRLGKLEIEVSEIVGADSVARYRNKAQFPVTKDGIGMYRRRSHQVIPVTDCLIQPEIHKAVLQTVRRWMQDFQVAPYDEETHTGVVRHVYLRWGEGLLVCLVTRTEALPHTKALCDALLALDCGIVGILQNVNDRKTNVILGRQTNTLCGAPLLTDTLGGVSFEIAPESFYQVNHRQTEKLYAIAKEYAALTGKEILWDLYCGIGTVGQFMADKAAKVIGVEIVPEAVENAKKNAENNRISHASYVCGTAEALAPQLLNEAGRPDVVVVDPPRKGCARLLLETIAQSAPERIVYISCNPATLARDLQILQSLDYVAKEATPVDLFPRTPHVETVCLLTHI